VYCGDDTAAVVVIVFCVIVVPVSVLLTQIDGDVCAVDTKERAERDLLRMLVDQLDGDVFCDESEVGLLHHRP
jgi:hypothetical protein